MSMLKLAMIAGVLMAAGANALLILAAVRDEDRPALWAGELLVAAFACVGLFLLSVAGVG